MTFTMVIFEDFHESIPIEVIIFLFVLNRNMFAAFFDSIIENIYDCVLLFALLLNFERETI